jgi:hypothetical protein
MMTAAASAQQAFGYVWRSHPHTGFQMSEHAMVAGTHWLGDWQSWPGQ